MHSNRPTLLLTGFGPFPTVPVNATSLLVPRMAEAAVRAFPGIRIECHILPTEWGAGLAMAGDLYRRLRPDAAIHFGVSGRASGFEIEARACNACAQSQDAAGFLPDGPQISPRGPKYLNTTLPASQIVERLRRRGIPAILSRDAGRYLCNALLYRSQELARDMGPSRSGFIHLPSSLVHDRNPRRGPLGNCRLVWDDVITGGIEAITATMGITAARVTQRRTRVLA
jgi:pyroglutamyl-peptidase